MTHIVTSLQERRMLIIHITVGKLTLRFVAFTCERECATLKANRNGSLTASCKLAVGQ